MRTTTVALGVVTAVLLAGCGTSRPDPRSDAGASRTTAPSSSASPEAATTTPSPTTPSPTTHRSGRLLLAPGDEATLSGKRCRADFAAGLVCSADGRHGYRFRPGDLRRVRAVEVGAARLSDGQWSVRIDLDRAGAAVLERLTRTVQGAHQLALVLAPRPGRVLTAAQVSAPIVGGNLQVSGDYSRAEADRIVRQITVTSG
jgi:hypothetical protein